MAEYPQSYLKLLNIGNATTCSYSTDIGFDATWINIMTTEAVDVWWDFTGAVPVTTCHYKLATNTQQTFPQVPPIAAYGVYTTSTAATNKIVRIMAMGKP